MGAVTNGAKGAGTGELVGGALGPAGSIAGSTYGGLSGSGLLSGGRVNPGALNVGKGPLSGFIGQGGGAAGTGFAAPQGANVMQPVTADQLSQAQGGVNNSLDSQQRLLSALQGQNGLGMQSNVANQQQALAGQLGANNGAGYQGDALAKQQAFVNQLNAANGIGTQNQAIQGLQNAAGMYSNIAQGRGPNPAQAALNNATGQNVANQAALMAGQRGAGSNVGLLARQAAQQGAATQQQAVGQGAQMQAQQQLNALSGLTGAQQAIGGLGSTQAGMQQAGINQQGSLANAAIGQQQAQQQAMANQANTMAGQQIGATTANSQANLANQQQLQNALAGYNSANVASQGNVNSANAGLANTVMQGQQGLFGGAMSGLGSALGMAEGGEVDQPSATPPAPTFSGFLSNWVSNQPAPQAPDMSQPTPAPQPQKSSGGGASSLMPLLAAAAAKGGLAERGGHVTAPSKAQKAIKGGDSYSNDKIPARLSEGEIVLPRSVTMGDDPIAASAEFVKKVLAKRGARKHG